MRGKKKMRRKEQKIKEKEESGGGEWNYNGKIVMITNVKGLDV